MKVSPIFKSAFFLIILAFLCSACSKKQESVPGPAVAAPKVAPVQAPPPAPALAEAPAVGFDGEWNGDSGENLPISFSVQGNHVTSLNASYSGKNGTCSYNGSISSEGPSPIADKAFTASGKNTRSGLIEFTAKGAFTSSTEASGTLVWKGTSDLCGAIDLQYKWTAKRAPAESMD